MTEVLLIRHGQSANNAQAEHLRVPDPGLTDIGQLQAQALAEWLARQSISHLYCSPFLRSLETIRPLADCTQLPVRIRSNLFELGGCYSGHVPGTERGEPGLGKLQLAASYPTWEIDQLIGDRGWWGREYETLEQGAKRAAEVVAWLASEVSAIDGVHVLVIHADFKRLVLQAMAAAEQLAASGIDLANVPLRNTGVTRCVFNSKTWHIGEFNATEHLSPELVT